MTLFHETDKRIVHTDVTNLELEHSYALEELEDEDTIPVVQYSCSASVAKDRLELMGYNREVAELVFHQELRDEIERHEAYVTGPHGDFWKESLVVLHDLTPGKWLTALEEIGELRLKPISLGDLEANQHPPLLQHMFTHNWYGFPGYDQRPFLRLVLEAYPETAELIYDPTDLYLGGWVDGNEDLVEYADHLISDDFAMSRRIIILTKGNTDRWILERSLNLLYPHLSDYFRFLDFEGARIGGGAGALANIVKAFAGAGIINRIVAVFDNDTAAEEAVRTLDAISIPNSIAIFQYPTLELARDYPTIGPSGLVSMDVNGLAGSIELYLGTDVLGDDDGDMLPVQWCGYDRNLKKYQGEILNKATLQQEFDRKLRACEKDASQVDKYDWAGIRFIIDEMRRAFQKKDATEILGRMPEHY